MNTISIKFEVPRSCDECHFFVGSFVERYCRLADTKFYKKDMTVSPKTKLRLRWRNCPMYQYRDFWMTESEIRSKYDNARPAGNLGEL